MRKQIKMAAFGGVQLQHARQVFQEGGRHADVAALLKPRVPGQAYPGQRGDLLTPQPRRAATAAGGQAQVRRVEACAPQAQEFGQIGARAVQAFGGGGWGHQGARIGFGGRGYCGLITAEGSLLPSYCP
ncbi:hypothetical protein D3C73_1105270 [compost metagenome]